MGRFVQVNLCTLLPLTCFAVVHVHAERVVKDIYDYCNGFGNNDFDIQVENHDEVYLETGVWRPVGNSRCRVVLKASNGISDLYYQFQSYSSSEGFTVQIDSKHTIYNTEGIYTTDPPSLFQPEKTNTYLRFTVTRDAGADVLADIDFSVKIYREEYHSTIGDIIGLSIGTVVAIVIAVIILNIVIIVCCVMNSTNRGSSGGQLYNSQSYTGQPYASQTCSGQPYADQPYGDKPQAGQTYEDKTYSVEGIYLWFKQNVLNQWEHNQPELVSVSPSRIYKQ